mmetsp:Transcript_20727/g.33414  ORF Transcript_20727/g.33414 Transcript_20727/m.33414 type:complete len:111 (+) Transcript_20727:176-508(+)
MINNYIICAGTILAMIHAGFMKSTKFMQRITNNFLSLISFSIFSPNLLMEKEKSSVFTTNKRAQSSTAAHTHTHTHTHMHMHMHCMRCIRSLHGIIVSRDVRINISDHNL